MGARHDAHDALGTDFSTSDRNVRESARYELGAAREFADATDQMMADLERLRERVALPVRDRDFAHGFYTCETLVDNLNLALDIHGFKNERIKDLLKRVGADPADIASFGKFGRGLNWAQRGATFVQGACSTFGRYFSGESWPSALEHGALETVKSAAFFDIWGDSVIDVIESYGETMSKLPSHSRIPIGF